MTAWMRAGMECINFLQVSDTLASRCHIVIILDISMCLVVLSTLDNLPFTIPHNVSMGFRSGELPGHFNTVMSCVFKKFMHIFAVWQGALSCIKIPWSTNQSLIWVNTRVSRILKYCSLFMEPSQIWRRPAPFTLMMPHTMTFGGCFTRDTVSLGRSGLLQTLLGHELTHSKVDSSLKATWRDNKRWFNNNAIFTANEHGCMLFKFNIFK